VLRKILVSFFKQILFERSLVVFDLSAVSSARDGKGLAPRLAGPERSGALDSPVARLAPGRQRKGGEKIALG
jgi:hypothetical protein